MPLSTQRSTEVRWAVMHSDHRSGLLAALLISEGVHSDIPKELSNIEIHHSSGRNQNDPDDS